MSSVVFVLIHDLEYDGEQFIGVYSTKELAIQGSKDDSFSTTHDPPREIDGDLWIQHPRIPTYGYWVREVVVDG